MSSYLHAYRFFFYFQGFFSRVQHFLAFDEKRSLKRVFELNEQICAPSLIPTGYLIYDYF